MKMPIPDDWDSISFCRWAVCWPDSPKWKAILYGLIESPTQGRFWDFDTGSFITVREEFKPAYDYNFELKEVLMSCGSDTANALLAIASAISGLTVGAGGNCTSNCYASSNVNVWGYVDLDGETFPIYGTVEPPVLPESGFPNGYDDAIEYDADKCQKANKIADDFIDTLTTMGTSNWAVGVLGAAAIVAALVGLITVPPAVVPLLLFALTTNIAITTSLLALADYLRDNREELVCAMYEGDSVETVIAAIAAVLTIAIAAIPIEGQAAIVVKQIALWLVNSDTLGSLFTSDFKGVYSGSDCSDCSQEYPTLQVLDEDQAWVDSELTWGEEVTFEPVLCLNGYYYAYVRIKPPNGQTEGEYTFEVTSATNSNSGNCPDDYTSPGTYINRELQEGGNTGWEFGCTNQFQTSFTGQFYRT